MRKNKAWRKVIKRRIKRSRCTARQIGRLLSEDRGRSFFLLQKSTHAFSSLTRSTFNHALYRRQTQRANDKKKWLSIFLILPVPGYPALLFLFYSSNNVQSAPTTITTKPLSFIFRLPPNAFRPIIVCLLLMFNVLHEQCQLNTCSCTLYFDPVRSSWMLLQFSFWMVNCP